jgi:sucrose phosphorylase
VPYELCVSLFDALNNPKDTEAEELQINRFLAANAVLLSLQGVPGIYIHSIFGSPSDHQGLAESGINRRLNRHKFGQAELDGLLGDKTSRASTVLSRYSHLLKVRASHPAFHPNAPQEVRPSKQVLHIVRGHESNLHCLINVTPDVQSSSVRGMDLITGRAFGGRLEAYQVAWVAEL